MSCMYCVLDRVGFVVRVMRFVCAVSAAGVVRFFYVLYALYVVYVWYVLYVLRVLYGLRVV